MSFDADAPAAKMRVAELASGAAAGQIEPMPPTAAITPPAAIS